MKERKRLDRERRVDGSGAGGGEQERMLDKVKRALKTTKNKSTAGPDGITWRLLKFIAKTSLGVHIMKDVVKVAE